MKIILSVFILVSTFSLYAQEKLEFRTRYYDKDSKPLESSEGAYYYVYDTVGAAYGGYYYYMASNKLKGVVGPGKADDPRRETWYYENGNGNGSGELTVDGNTYKYTSIEEPATLVYGVQGLYKDISKTMKYPSSARKEKAQGTVYVEFQVQKDGTTTDYRIIKGFHPACDEEALDTMKKIASKWNPGLHRGVPAKVRFAIPIKFSLG